MPELSPQQALDVWRLSISESVRRDGPDLTARQMAVILAIYKTEPPHTVRGLAADLGVTKPVITRAIDRLSYLGLVKRRRDPADRRNVLLQRTVRGSVFLSEFGEIVAHAANRVE